MKKIILNYNHKFPLNRHDIDWKYVNNFVQVIQEEIVKAELTD